MSDPTQHACPESPHGDPHHLTVHYHITGGEPIGESVCVYCGRTRAELVDDIGRN